MVVVVFVFVFVELWASTTKAAIQIQRGEARRKNWVIC